MSSSHADELIGSQRVVLLNNRDEFFKNGNQCQDDGDLFYDGNSRIVDTVDAAVTSQWHQENLQNSMRNMKIKEVSAEDDDEHSRDVITHAPKTNQSGSSINNNQTEEDVTPQFEYDMSRAARGRAVIVNNVNFAPHTGMSKRAGSEKDAEELADVLRLFGFSTERYSDLTCLQLIRIFQNVSEEDHSNNDCFVFALMTHGTDGAVYCKDGVLSLDELMQELKGDRCITLAGKPKLLFIQACRGQRLDSGVGLAGEDQADGGGSRRGGQLVIPAEADFLVAYSTPPGYYSYRNNANGAWFIQALVKVLKDHGSSLEINQLLTRVNHIVAYEYTSASNMPDFNGKKQMPYYTSTLTKELYFRAPPSH